MSHDRGVRVIAIALVLAACSAPPPMVEATTPDTQTIVGRHIVYTAPYDQTVCGGTVPWLDDALDAQAATLGLTVPARVRYDWQPDGIPCPGAGGCTEGTQVFALYPDMAHELAHALLAANRVSAPSFLDEGDAVALGGDEGGGGVVDDRALDPLLAAAPLSHGDYATAGDLVSYLLDTRGPAPFVALLRATHWGDSAATIRAAFATAYGDSLDDVVAARTMDPRMYVGDHLSVPECAAPPIAWQGATASAQVHVDCDGGVGPHPVGAIGAPPEALRYVTVDVPADGDYTIALSPTGYVAPCGAGDALLIGGGTKDVHLVAGRIYAELSTPVDQPADFTFTVTAR